MNRIEIQSLAMQHLYYVEAPIAEIGAVRGDLLVEDPIGGLSLIHRIEGNRCSVRSLRNVSLGAHSPSLRMIPATAAAAKSRRPDEAGREESVRR